MEEIREEEGMEESPITSTDFNTAIDTINKKLDRLMEVTENKMEEKIEVTRQTREICKDLLQETHAVAEDLKYMDSEKEKKDQKDKESKIIAHQH
eukprot:10517817-Heterocapsa_arctica.AAC.1